MVNPEGDHWSWRGLFEKVDRNIQRDESVSSKLCKSPRVVTRIVSNNYTIWGLFRACSLDVFGQALGSLDHSQGVHAREASRHSAA